MNALSKFGWSYPPGAANDPNAPYNQTDEIGCAVCGGGIADDCICPKCPVCGALGDPICYDGKTMAGCYQCRMAVLGVASIRHQHRSSHGLVRSPEQIAKRTALDAAIAEEAAQLELYIDAEMIFNTFGLSTDRVMAMSTIKRECCGAGGDRLPTASALLKPMGRTL